MRRLVLMTVASLLSLVLASPAFAFQCPKLVKQLNDETARRFDRAATEAKVAARQAQSLHEAGKHAESEKAAKDALATLGIKS